MDSTGSDSIGRRPRTVPPFRGTEVAGLTVLRWDGHVDRRRAISLLAAGVLAACSTSDRRISTRKEDPVETITYGTDPAQRAELSRPAGRSKGVVVILHGGFWRAQYDLGLGRPLARSLVAAGWTAYNVEYRRVGNGGGWPATFDDVSVAIDRLATIEGIDTARVITLGHSAGGHLAVWAAGRGSQDGVAWSDPAVRVTAAVSQAGVLDLRGATRLDLGNGAAQALMGGGVDARYALADPTAQIPLSVPVRCVHGRSDDIVPLSQSADYVERARRAGADAELIEVDGDHFVVIDPASPAWARTLVVLETL
ncbi:MAG: alpha/beta hydrolase [Aeromicrobium sp.]|nr:alpha/beta hydrolase [Aeromicrobium sp.]